MALRPIDMTITVQRTPEINRTQTGENTRPEVTHQQVADRLNREVQQQDQQVIQTSESQEGRIGRDGRGNSGGESSGNRRKKDKNTDTQKNKPESDSLFDVSI